jgi:hypothetical protein
MPNDDTAAPGPLPSALADASPELRAWRSVITKGWSASQSRWPLGDIKPIGWGGLLSLVNPTEIEPEDRRHTKDGPCFVPAVMAPLEPGGRMAERTKTSVRQITMLVFDLDRGSSYASVAARLQRAGVAAVVAPTYSHLNKDAAFKVLPERWEPYIAALGSPEEMARTWCAREFVPSVVAGGLEGPPVVTQTVSAKGKPIIKVALRLARPRPRWRVVVPLAAPWEPAEGPGAAAAARWALLYIQLAEALGLWDTDPACGDASRLYYSARWPAAWPVEGPWDLLSLTVGEPRPETGVAAFLGPLADWQALLDRHAKTTWLQRLGAAEDAERRRWEHDSAAAIAAAPALPGHAGRRRSQGRTPWLIRRPGSDAEIDLTAWHAQYGWDLMLASLIQERAPELLAERADSPGGNVHVICPMSDLHGTVRDDGSFVWDGCGWPPPTVMTAGLRRGGMFCNHTACSDRSEGENLAVLLTAGVLTWDDLDEIEARITAGRQGAMAELPTVDDTLLYSDDEITAERASRLHNEDRARAGDLDTIADSASAADDQEEQDPATAWQDLDPRPVVAKTIYRFNRNYMLVGDGGPSVIKESYDPAVNSYSYTSYKPQAFPMLFRKYPICIDVDEKGKPIRANPATVWLDHPKGRWYEHGFVFNPRGSARRGYYNLWKGWGVEARQGDWSLLRTHIKEVICSNDEATFAYLLGWMADLTQVPNRKPEVLVAIRGKEGSGRGIVFRALLKLVGTHGLYLNAAEQLTGRFNDFMHDKLFVFADEAFFPGDKKNIGKLKSMITETLQLLEAKFKQARPAASYYRVASATNEDWVVPAGLHSRRYFVLDASDAHMQDHRYFAAIQAQLESGGYEAMLYDLLHHDLSNFNVREVPVTAALNEQRERSLPGEYAWLKHILARGHVWETKLGLNEYFDRWHPDVTTALLYRSYEDFMRGRRFEGRRLSIELLGRFLVAMGYVPKHLSNGVSGERWASNPIDRRRSAELVKVPRPRGYIFGDLAAARDAFCKATGLPAAWGDDAEADGDEADDTDAEHFIDLPPPPDQDLDGA